ncbi:MAG: FGGY family carbohydrate kinase [Actinomycetaceae bacterium]|nr:FGGY family carbohydrate kinase [Actinomycetaceae bacterium]
MSEYVLALDEGTTNAKAAAIGRDGRIIATASRPLSTHHPAPAHVEQDPEIIWSALLSAAEECIAKAGGAPNGIAISNQRESVLAWDGTTGQAAAPLIGWQDARTFAFCDELRRHASATTSNNAEDLVRARTGLHLDAMFSAPKIRYLLDQVTGSHTPGTTHTDTLRVGTVDTWLVSRLTGGAQYLAEAGNAGRTLLLNLDTQQWDPDLCALFGIDPTLLAPIARSDAHFGVTANLGESIPDDIPIVAVLGDSHAALFGHGCHTPGHGKTTYGTGSSAMIALGTTRPTNSAAPTTLAWLTNQPFFALEGNIVATGTAMDWVARTLGVKGGRELDTLAATEDSSGGVSFIPAFTGLGAPWWDREAVATLSGMTAATTRGHIARAAVECVAHQVADVIESFDADLVSLRADGGASRSPLLMQIQADLLGRPVTASPVEEISLLGAALMGFASLGWEIPSIDEAGARTYSPQISADERDSRRAAWKEAIGRSRA